MTAVAVDFQALAARVEKALRAEFPTDTIDLEEGYLGRVHVRIISKRFNGMRERDRQAILWDILRLSLGEDAQFVSLVLPYGTDELP